MDKIPNNKNGRSTNVEKENENNCQAMDISTGGYINETLDDFDHSFTNSTANNLDILNSLPPVDKNEQFSVRGVPVMKASEGSKVIILTGNITQVLKWSQNFKSCQIYETIGIYASDWDSGNHFQRILLLRQPRGPVMKVYIFNRKYPEMPNCIPGQYLKVIGRISEENIMIADKVSSATEIDFRRLERATKICDRVAKHYQM